MGLGFFSSAVGPVVVLAVLACDEDVMGRCSVVYRAALGTLEHTVNALLCCRCPHDLDYIIISTLSGDISHGGENFEWDLFCVHRNFGIINSTEWDPDFATGRGGGACWEMVGWEEGQVFGRKQNRAAAGRTQKKTSRDDAKSCKASFWDVGNVVN